MASQLRFTDGHVITLSTEISYNFQVANVGDLSLSKSNYTSQFQIPRSDENTTYFEGLGLPTDRSSFPYNLNNVQCLDDYTEVYSGILVILNTDELYYNATVINGVFDFFSVLEDKTFADLPFAANVQPKVPSVVVPKITQTGSPNDTYIAANYGGQTHVEVDGVTYVNVDAMVPAYKVQYLVDQVFQEAGFTYDANINFADLTEEYLTFPYPPYLSVIGEGTLRATASRGPAANVGAIGPDDESVVGFPVFDSSSVPGGGFTISGNTITATAEGLYLIRVVRAGGQYTQSQNPQGPFPFTVWIRINGIRVAAFTSKLISDFEEEINFQTVVNLSPGSVVDFEYVRTDPGPRFTSNWAIFSTDIEIYNSAVSPEGVRQIFSLRLADFIKEFMARFNLIAFQEGPHVSFVTLSSILNDGTPVDWSEKYQKRTNEKYDIGYAVNNWLRHSYDVSGSDYFDRNIQSNNQNLPATKTIIESKFFAPSFDRTSFFMGGSIESNTRLLRTYRNFEEDSNGSKVLNRNFWIGKRNEVGTIAVASAQFPYLLRGANAVSMMFEEYRAAFSSSPYWPALTKILWDTRAHTIELSMDTIDAQSLDLKSIYFFQQESSYYMINKLQYTDGELVTAELIKVN